MSPLHLFRLPVQHCHYSLPMFPLHMSCQCPQPVSMPVSYTSVPLPVPPSTSVCQFPMPVPPPPPVPHTYVPCLFSLLTPRLSPLLVPPAHVTVVFHSSSASTCLCCDEDTARANTDRTTCLSCRSSSGGSHGTGGSHGIRRESHLLTHLPVSSRVLSQTLRNIS